MIAQVADVAAAIAFLATDPMPAHRRLFALLSDTFHHEPEPVGRKRHSGMPDRQIKQGSIILRTWFWKPRTTPSGA